MSHSDTVGPRLTTKITAAAAPAETAALATPRAAAEQALEAELGASAFGAYQGQAEVMTGMVVEHFECTLPGYPHWSWVVEVVLDGAGAPIAINSVTLLPGEDAIVAPRWVPWRERIRPGDLSPGDVLPAPEDDPRLVPTYLVGDPAFDEVDDDDHNQYREVGDTLGLGRRRVLSHHGRAQAMERWYRGDQGPDAKLAKAAPADCVSCGFLVRLAGPLSRHFGVCANEYANDDGRVVALNHGCGAHSDAQLRRKQLPPPLPEPAYDTITQQIEPF